MSDKTYNDDEVQALVAAAVAKATDSLQSELSGFRSTEDAAALEAKISEARAEVEAAMADLQSKLDEAVATSTQVTKERDEIVSWLESANAELEHAAEIAQRSEERIAAVAEVIDFPEEHVAERSAEWAAMEDDKFEALLADYRALATRISGTPKVGDQGPSARATAMVATRDTGGSVRKVGSAVSEVIAMYKLGVDPRAIH